MIDLNAVAVEQLRQRDISMTQATRLLAHRERLGGFRSVEDLDQVGGVPRRHSRRSEEQLSRLSECSTMVLSCQFDAP
jgi:DNA uptake protein ComE-like DNA-binding protein